MNPDAHDDPEDAPVEYPITDEIDLHTFQPEDVAELLVDYLDVCVERGFTEVRIVHGKGRGTLRELVHAQVRRHPAFRSLRMGGESEGGWGATVVTLKGSGDRSS